VREAESVIWVSLPGPHALRAYSFEATFDGEEAMKKLLIIIAAAETATGLGLVAFPWLVASLIFGSTLETPVALAVARIAGVALLALGIACWMARADTGSRAARGIISAMLIYNAGVCALLLYAALGAGLSSIALWPVTIAHAGLAAWCLACLAGKTPAQ
jgi:hypothetical protein